MCLPQNYLFNNMSFMNGGSMLGGYQFGMGIADLFTGVPGLNTVWNFGNGGFSNYGYGYGTGCSCNDNSWAMALGATLVNMGGAIGISWINKARADKAADEAEQKRKEAETAKNTKNAVKSMNIDGIASVDQLLELPKDEALAKIKAKQIDEKYNDDAKKVAGDTLDTAIETLKQAETNISNVQIQIGELDTEINNLNAEIIKLEGKLQSANDSTKSNIQQQLDDKKAELEKLKQERDDKQKSIEKGGDLYEAKANAEKAKQDAENKLKEIKKAQADFKTAKERLIEAVEAHAREVEADEAAKLDDADGNILNRRAEKNKKYLFNNNNGQVEAIEHQWVKVVNDAPEYYTTPTDGATEKPISTKVLAESMTERDWRGLISDYRTEGDNIKKAIIDFVGKNWDVIKNYENKTIKQGLKIIYNKYKEDNKQQ